ncbi:OmpA family protein [Pseudanabaena biceps]|nr:OmpA family protein [Pseudanabaena biceps]
MSQIDNSETKSNEVEPKMKDEIPCEQIKDDIKGLQIASHLVATEFGEVNVFRENVVADSTDAKCRVEFTIAMEPQGKFAEGWRTGLALDASASMKRAYGRKVEARVDPTLLTDYIKQGRLKSYMEDGEPTRKIQREAFAEIRDRGYEVNYTANILQPLVQDFTAYLASNLDATGKTSLIYWGCGQGEEVQVLGEFDNRSCEQLTISGPATFQLGKTTKLLPAIAYFMNQHREAQRGIYIFLTDGRIDDLEQVKSYTKELALEIAVGKRNYVKLILIGIGNDVDRYQLQELDDFDNGLDIDLWDYKIASEMTNLSQIFAEVVNENHIIAENAAIYDDLGNCVKTFNGLPAKADFLMRHDSRWFELEVSGQRIRQSVVVDAAIAPLPAKGLLDFEINALQANHDLLGLEQDQNLSNQSDQVDTSSHLWKLGLGIFVGAAFIGTMIAFGILIKRSDDNRLQNIPPTKTSMDQSVDTLTNPSINPSDRAALEPQVNSSPKTIISTNNAIDPSSTPKNSDRPKNNPVNNSTNTLVNSSVNSSTLPIAKSDVEVSLFFQSDESQLMASEVAKLNEFWAKIQGRKGIIQVSGHSDNTGDYDYNLLLSQSRANEVMSLLRDRGLDSKYKVSFEALSWSQPLRKGSTADVNALNRRVVLQFKEK